MKNKIKNLYILPGWGERVTDKNYRRLISACPNFKFCPLKFTTRNPKFAFGVKPIGEIFSSLEKQIKNPHTIIGFSAGALLAYLIAPRVKPTRLVLCSLPPLVGKISDKKFLTKIQISELSSLEYSTYPATIFYGSRERADLKKINKKLGGIEIKNAEHKLEGKYLDVVIKKINIHKSQKTASSHCAYRQFMVVYIADLLIEI